MAEKFDPIRVALNNVSEAAHVLSLHGAQGYSLDTGALDYVFQRTLNELAVAFEESSNADYYDPDFELRSRLDDQILK